MALSYSTLVVTLAGLQLQNLQQVITARGIDRVLVVDTPSGFSSTSGIAAVSAAANLRSAPSGQLSQSQAPGLSFAFAGGENSVTLSAAGYGALGKAGFTFVQDPGLDSFSSTVVLNAASLAQGSTITQTNARALSTELLAEGEAGVKELANSALFNGTASDLYFNPSVSLANKPALSVAGGIAGAGILSDFGGSVRVNVNASEFASLAQAKVSTPSLPIQVSDPANLTVDDAPAAQTTANGLNTLLKPLTNSSYVPGSSVLPANLLTARAASFQVDTLTLGGTFEVGDVVSAVVNNTTVSVNAASTTRSAIASQLVAEITANSTVAAAVTASTNGDVVTLTAKAAGTPFTVSSATAANRPSVAQVSGLTLTGTYEVGDVVSAVVNGTTVSVNAASTTLSAIASQLAAAITANSTVAAAVTASTNGDVVTLTAKAAGTPFTVSATAANKAGGTDTTQAVAAATSTANVVVGSNTTQAVAAATPTANVVVGSNTTQAVAAATPTANVVVGSDTTQAIARSSASPILNTIALTPALLDALFASNQRAGDWAPTGDSSTNDIGKYAFAGDVELTVSQFRALPQEGAVAPNSSILTLKGTSAELTLVLEEARLQRTAAGASRLDSVNRILITDAAPLVLSAETFAALDQASLRTSLDNQAGITKVERLVSPAQGTTPAVFAVAAITIAANGTSGGTANLTNLQTLGITQRDNPSTTNANEADLLSTALPGTPVGANLINQVKEIELQFNLTTWLTTPAEKASILRLQASLPSGTKLTLNPDNTSGPLSASQAGEVIAAFPPNSALQVKPNSINISESVGTSLQALFTANALDSSLGGLVGSVSGPAGSVTLNGNQLNSVLSGGIQPQQRLFILRDTAAGIGAFIKTATDGSTAGTQLSLAGVQSISRTDSGAPIPVTVREFEFLRTQQASGLTLPNSLLQIVDSNANIQSFIDTAFNGSSLRSGYNLAALAGFTTVANGIPDASLVDINTQQLLAVNAQRTSGLNFAPGSFRLVDTSANLQAAVTALAAGSATNDLTLVKSLATGSGRTATPFFAALSAAQVVTLNTYLAAQPASATSTQIRRVPAAIVNLNDTAANINNLLINATDTTPLELGFLWRIIGSETGATIELSYSQFQALRGTSNLTSLSKALGLTSIEIVVTGSGEELQQLFATYGTDFSNLEANISFRISDGAEVKLNASQLDKLDGRIEGAVVVADTNANLEKVFDNAIPTSVKTFQLLDGSGNIVDVDRDGSLDGDTITLTVNGLAGLPGYLDANVVLRDTDENIERRLRSDLDYRVSRIEVSGSGINSESALNLRIGQLERLLDNGVEIATGVSIILDPRDTLEINALAASGLPAGFQGKLVIADDGDALRSLFDGIWNIPAGATTVQLRSLDNAPLQLNVAQLEQLVGSYPAFSGAIELIDGKVELGQYINGNPALIDPRVVSISVEGFELPDGAGGQRLLLTASQLSELQVIEGQLGIKLFEGTINLDQTSFSAATLLPSDSRLELTAAQVNAKLQALLNSVNDQIRPDLDALKASIIAVDSSNDSQPGGVSVIERLNQLAAQVTKLDRETVTVAELRTLLADPSVPANDRFTIADTNAAIRSLLSGAAANTLALTRVSRLIPTQSADAALTLSISELEVLLPGVVVENLVVADSASEILSRWDSTTKSFDLDPRVDAVRVASAGLQPEALELTVEQYQSISGLMPEGRFVLTDSSSNLLAQLRVARDERVVAIEPTGSANQPGVLSISNDADLALLPEVIGTIALTTTSARLADLVRSSEFNLSEFSSLASSDGQLLSVDAETLALLPGNLHIVGGLVLRDSAGDVAEVLSNPLDRRLVGIESRSGELILSVRQLQQLETLESNLEVTLRDDSDAITAYLAAGLPSLAVHTISVSNGDRLNLSSDSFANLLAAEGIAASRLYAGQIQLSTASEQVDFVPTQLADTRVTGLSVSGTDQLVLKVSELERLGTAFGGKVILEDSLAAIKAALASPLDSRVQALRAVDLQTNGLVPIILDANQLANVPSPLQSSITVVESVAGINRLLGSPQNTSYRLQVQDSGLVLSAEQFQNLGTVQLVKRDGSPAQIILRDTAQDIAGLIDIVPGAVLDPRILRLEPTNSNRLSLSLAQVANLPANRFSGNSIVVSDSVGNILTQLTSNAQGAPNLDARIQAFDLINGTQITLSASQFKSLQAAEDRLGYQLLSGPFKLQGLAGEEPAIADILDDQDSRVTVVSSPDIDQLILNSAQLRELGSAFSGNVILQDTAIGILDELTRSLDSRVIDIRTIGVSELNLKARQLLNLPQDFQGKVILDDNLPNIRSFINKPFNLSEKLTLQLSVMQLAELTKQSVAESLLTGKGDLIVTGFDSTSSSTTALVNLPRTFSSIEVVLDSPQGGVLELDNTSNANTPLQNLGALIDPLRRNALVGSGSTEKLYANDKLTINPGESVRISTQNLFAKKLETLLAGASPSQSSNQPVGQLILSGYTDQDVSQLNGTLGITVEVYAGTPESPRLIDSRLLRGVQGNGVDSIVLATGGSYVISSNDAAELQTLLPAAPSGQQPQDAILKVTGYLGQDFRPLASRVGRIDIQVETTQALNQALLPDQANLWIYQQAELSATDAATLKNRLQNANEGIKDAAAGVVRVLGYTGQDLIAPSGSDFATSLNVVVEVAVADLSSSINRLAQADQVVLAPASQLRLTQQQAEELAGRLAAAGSGGSLRVVGYTGADLSAIASATAGATTVTLELASGQNWATESSKSPGQLQIFTQDADLIELASGSTLTLTADQAAALKGKLTGAGSLTITGYNAQDLTVPANAGFLGLSVTVETTAGSDISGGANLLKDVDVVKVGGNDVLTITASQADELKTKLLGVAPVQGETAGQVVVKSYAGGDLSAIADQSASSLDVKLQIASGTSFTADAGFVTRVSDADVIELASGSTLTLTADQAAALKGKLTGAGSLTITGYNAQDLSSGASTLSVAAFLNSSVDLSAVTATNPLGLASDSNDTVVIGANGALIINAAQAVSLADNLLLAAPGQNSGSVTIRNYTGQDLSAIQDAVAQGLTINLEISSAVDLRAVNAASYLADVDRITVAPGGELAIDNSNYAAITGKFQGGSQQGVLNVVNIDPTAGLQALKTAYPNLTIDVTLKNGTQASPAKESFSGGAADANLSVVRNIYVPQYAELGLTFSGAVVDRAGTFNGSEPDYPMEFIKKVPGQEPGTLNVVMSDYTAVQASVASAGLQQLLAFQAAGNYTLKIDLPATVSLTLDASDVDLFDQNLSGAGSLVVNSYAGQDISRLAATLASVTINVANGTTAVLPSASRLPVITSGLVTLNVGANATLVVESEQAEPLRLSNQRLVLSNTSTLAIQAGSLNRFGAITAPTGSVVELLNYTGSSQVLTKASDATLHAVIGQPGTAATITLDSIDSLIDKLSVSQGSTLTIGNTVSGAGIDIDVVRGQLSATAAFLSGKSIDGADSLKVDLGESFGQITVRDLQRTTNLAQIDGGYTVRAEVSAATATDPDFAFDAVGFNAIDQYLITSAGTVLATAAELNGKQVAPATGLEANAVTFTVGAYTSQSLQGLDSGLVVDVTTANGATLEAGKLSNADTITVAGSTSSTVSAADADTFGSKLRGDGTLNVIGYTDQYLSDITTAKIGVTTVDGVTLAASKLTSVDTVTVVGVNNVSAAEALAFAPTFGGTGTLRVTEALASAEQLKVLNTKSTALINAASVTSITGAAADLAAIYTAASTEISGLDNEAVTLSTDPSTAELKAISTRNSGTITFSGPSGYGLALPGSAADVAAALSGTFAAPFTGSVTITDSTVATIAELKAINSKTAGVITLNAESIAASWVDTASNLLVALEGLTSLTGLIAVSALPAGAAGVGALNTIAGTTNGLVTASVSGSAAQLALLTTTATDLIAVTITDSTVATVEQLKTINGKTAGIITLNAASIGNAWSDTAANLNEAFAGITSVTGTITATAVPEGPTGVTAVNTIAGITNGLVTASVSGSAAQLALLTTTATDLIAVTITDSTVATIAELKAINSKTAGIITLNAESIAASWVDTASNLLDALEGLTSLTGLIAVSALPAGAAGVGALNTIAGTTNGLVTASVSGSAAELALLTTTATDLVAATITGDAVATVEQLKMINSKTAGVITLNAASIGNAWSDTAANLSEAFAGITSVTGTITATAVPEGPTGVTAVNTIAGITNGVVTASVSGSAAELALLTTGATDAIGVTITGATVATITELKAINSKTAGIITLNAASIGNAWSDTAANLSEAFAGITSVTGTIAVTDSQTGATGVTAVNTIAGITNGVVTASVSGSAAQLALLTTAPSDNLAVTITDTASVAQVNSIDAATSGVVTATLNPGTLDSFASLTGTGNAYTITINDSQGSTFSASALAALGGKTTAPVTVNSPVTVTGTVDEVVGAVVTATTKVNLPASTTINATGYTGQDLTAISAANYTLNVSASTSDSSAISAAFTDGKLVSADVVTLTAASGAQTANLRTLANLGSDLDRFLIDADTNNSVLSVRLSETLSKSSALDIRLDGGDGTNAVGDPAWSKDTILLESNLTGATTGSTPYTNETWSGLGLGGANIYNFVSNKDSFGVVDSSGALVFTSWKLGLPTGGAFTTDGRVFLDVSGFVDINSVQEIRNYIGDEMVRSNSGFDSGFALLGRDADGQVDIGIFHAKWLGASNGVPESDSSQLKVTRLAVLQNVNVEATVGLTSALQAPNFIATSLPTGLGS